MLLSSDIERIEKNEELNQFLKSCGGAYLDENKYRKTGMFDEYTKSYWYDFYKVACPVCGKVGYCSINFAKAQIMCHHESTWSGKEGKARKNGAYIFNITKSHVHIHVSDALLHQEMSNNAKLAPAEQCDKVYRVLLEHGELADDCKNDLLKRGLSEETITRMQFCSQNNLTAKAISKYFTQTHDTLQTDFENWFVEAGLSKEAWKGVPGFYRWCHEEKNGKKSTVLFDMAQSNGKSTMNGYNLPAQKHSPYLYLNNKGYLIPVTNINNQIVAFQERHLEMKEGMPKYSWVSSANNDSDGVSPHAPVNVALIPSLAKNRNTKQVQTWLKNQPKSVIITEGILKSIVTAELLEKDFNCNTLQQLGAVVLGNGGVTMYRKFIPVLKQLKATTVYIAYDMDYQSNDMVKDSTNALIKELKQNGFRTGRLFWNSKNKGIDDCLLNDPQLSVKYY